MSQESSRRLTIVLYSDDVTVRAHVAAALGTRVASDLAPHSIIEFATGPALRSMSMAKLEVAITELISLSLMVSQPLKAAWELRANSKMSSLTARQFW